MIIFAPDFYGYMELICTTSKARLLFDPVSRSGSTGFVPTMGALHEGHLELVRRAASENDTVIVSIFVNPTQFNDKKDLERYPRNLEADIALLGPAGCHYVFAPAVEEIYPEPDTRVFDFGGLDRVMEGKFRPGHFNGVAQVVSRLFDIIQPDKAYFGLKDFQQLAVIRQMVSMLRLNVEIVPCPIVREVSGLAMSSRNELLSADERGNASLIYETLTQARKLVGLLPVIQLIEWISEGISKNPFLDVEYVDIVDDNTLTQVSGWDHSGGIVACVAVWCGKVRLIDNIIFKYNTQ
jgi:pantoate--beta-alanine ligase